MRKLIVAAILCLASQSQAAYFKTIFQDPAHPQMSAGLLFTPAFNLDAGVTEVAIIYHQADPEDSWIPKSIQAIGVKPISWSLLDAGLGGDRDNVIVPVGASINLTPTVLGPLLQHLKQADNAKLKMLGSILDSPAGGVAIGPKWEAKPIQGGTLLPLDRWVFSPRLFVGGLWKF